MCSEYEELFCKWTGNAQQFSEEVKRLALSSGAPSFAYSQLSTSGSGRAKNVAALGTFSVPNLSNQIRLMLNAAALEADPDVRIKFSPEDIESLLPLFKRYLYEVFRKEINGNHNYLLEKERFPGLQSLE